MKQKEARLQALREKHTLPSEHSSNRKPGLYHPAELEFSPIEGSESYGVASARKEIETPNSLIREFYAKKIEEEADLSCGGSHCGPEAILREFNLESERKFDRSSKELTSGNKRGCILSSEEKLSDDRWAISPSNVGTTVRRVSNPRDLINGSL